MVHASTAPIEMRYVLPQPHSTLAERFLLLMIITVLPLENHIPTVAEMSVSFLMFAVLAIYIIVNRACTLGRIWYHPVFIAAYAFIGVSALLEFSSPLSDYGEIIRFGQMIGGAVCVAVLCRDRSALAAGLWGYIAAALWVSVLIYLTSYGTLQDIGEVADFQQATDIRAKMGDTGLRDNINKVAFVCIQGAIVAFALSLSARFKHLRIVSFGIGIFCLVASFVPMSRGTVMIGLVSFAVILYTHGIWQGKLLILVPILGLAMYAFVPDAVWSRMVFSTEMQNDKMEARAWLYTTAIDRLQEYVVAGVGAGNYYGKWGVEKGFVRRGSVLGVHNTLLQIAIMWGILGLLMYLWIIWGIYRSVPLRCGHDELSLALLGVVLSLGLYLLTTHCAYEKTFALGVGMLIGARQWIWPTGIVSAVDTQNDAL